VFVIQSFDTKYSLCAGTDKAKQEWFSALFTTIEKLFKVSLAPNTSSFLRFFSKWCLSYVCCYSRLNPASARLHRAPPVPRREDDPLMHLLLCSAAHSRSSFSSHAPTTMIWRKPRQNKTANKYLP
jgi:hypothetical protein